MLGVPLGSDHFVSDFVEKKLIGRLSTTVDRLVDFEDTQSASYLLRVSFSIVRAVHFMRTTPLSQWKKQAAKFDVMVRSAIEKILAAPMDDLTFAQVSLTPRLGGLGLRKVVEHANLAYYASWHQSLKTAKEVWVPPPDLPPKYTSQQEASFQFDEKMHTYLIGQSDVRGAQRLRRAAQPHACGFITAVPSDEDGKDCVLPPRHFRTAVAYRLGLPVLNEETPCPLCEQPINIFGDHATCCTKSGDLIIRHNALRNLIGHIGADGLLSPVLEKKGILGNTNGRRPGDVTFQRWSGGKGLAVDVAVTSPLAPSNVRTIDPCEHYAAVQKHGKYDKSFEGTDYVFSAMVFETWKVRKCYASSFGLLQKNLDVSLLLIADVLGLVSPATYSAPSPRPSSHVPMATNSGINPPFLFSHLFLVPIREAQLQLFVPSEFIPRWKSK